MSFKMLCIFDQMQERKREKNKYHLTISPITLFQDRTPTLHIGSFPQVLSVVENDDVVRRRI